MVINNVKTNELCYATEEIVTIITPSYFLILMDSDGNPGHKSSGPKMNRNQSSIGNFFSVSLSCLCFPLYPSSSFSPRCFLLRLSYLTRTTTGPSLCGFATHQLCPFIQIPETERVWLAGCLFASGIAWVRYCWPDACRLLLNQACFGLVRAQRLALPLGNGLHCLLCRG